MQHAQTGTALMHAHLMQLTQIERSDCSNKIVSKINVAALIFLNAINLDV